MLVLLPLFSDTYPPIPPPHPSTPRQRKPPSSPPPFHLKKQTKTPNKNIKKKKKKDPPPSIHKHVHKETNYSSKSNVIPRKLSCKTSVKKTLSLIHI